MSIPKEMQGKAETLPQKSVSSFDDEEDKQPGLF